jgi:predicted AlkP superfamily pyrophosphatase or phosphodiesterase
VWSGVLAGYAAKPGHEREADASILTPHEGMHCWRTNEMPARLHYGTNPRIPPYVCLADDGWLIDTQAWLDDPNHHPSKGEHGYDNDDPNMRALFIAHGPAFKHGLVVPEFDNVDVYPLLAKILHITPQANDGNLDAVAGMLAEP